MQLSYTMQNHIIVYFQQGQELATAISHCIKYQRPDVPKKCLEIQFATSRIYPSLVTGIVNGLNMDELFSSPQAVPVPPSLTTTAAITGTHLATIATTISTAVTGLTSKTATNHANANRDEMIDYKDMPTNV